MKRQIVYIHGGHTYSSYELFLRDLATSNVQEPFDEPQVMWSHALQKSLDGEYSLCAPIMPNKQNAQYEEWKIWFERHFEFFAEEVSLIGWSLGAVFLTKYLSENKVPFRVNALFLVSVVATFEDLGKEGPTSFSPDFDLMGKLEEQVEHIHLFHSKDDFVVPFSHAEKYYKALPTSVLHVFEDRDHFLQADFPELIEEIKGLG